VRGLVLLSDDIGPRVAGPAIRAIALARVLADAGLEATIATLGSAEQVGERIEAVSLRERRARTLVDESAVVIIMGPIYRLMPWLAEHPVPIVMDLYDPYHIEYAARAIAQGIEPRPGVVDLQDEIDAQLARADLVLCSNERQRRLWAERLSAIGRIPAGSDPGALVAIAPFGTDAPPQKRSGAIRGRLPGVSSDDVIAIWGGGVYDWFDPVTLVEAMAVAASREPRLKLVFLSSAGSPEATTKLGGAVRRADELGLLGTRVHFNPGWVAYEERANWLTDADFGVTVHPESEETYYSHRTRDLDYLWAGLPIVTSDGDVFAELVRAEELGVVVPPGDPFALAEALVALAGDSQRRACLHRRVVTFAPQLRWSRTLAPFAEFAADPRRSSVKPVSAPQPIPARSSVRELTRSFWAAIRAGGLVGLCERLAARRARRKLGGS